MTRVALLAGLGFLVGGVPTGLLVVRRVRPGLDLRAVGTGNLGTSNIFRNVGTAAAVAVGPAQFAQGLLPVLLTRRSGADAAGIALVAVATVAGSAWSPWLRLQGGRGVAVATGAVAGLGLPGLAALLLCFGAGLAAGEIAVGVLGGFAVLPAVEALASGPPAASAAVGLLAIVVLRRLESVGDDLRGLEPHPDVPTMGRARVLADRLLRDRRPGRPLVGRPRSGR